MIQHNENCILIEQGLKRRKRRYYIVIATLVSVMVFMCVLLMTVGNTNYSLETVFRVLSGEEAGNAVFTIKRLRWPRMIAGLVAGFAFGMAGGVFQTMLRNPLANPNIIGITSASSVGAVFCILVLHTGGTKAFWGSIVMALTSAILIYLLASLRKFSVGRMILVGIGFQAMMNSVITYLLLIGNENDLASAMCWMSGSLNGVQMTNIYPLLFVMAVCIPLILVHAKSLEILELGEESAITIGVNTKRSRTILLIASVILVAVATATTGPISFVSFLSAPIAKRITGHGNSSPLIAGLFGSVLVLVADFIGQNAFEIRFPVGVITGLLGAPYLIYLLIRMNKQGEL